MAQRQDISIARAVFISALLRSESDAAEVTRDDATLFAKSLLKTCNICTTSNIKLCKSFILHNILPSITRTAALIKYMVILSKSFCPGDLGRRIDTTKPGDENEGLGKIVHGKVQQPPEPAFKRLHLLYILHDALCYAHAHLSILPAVTDQLRSALCTLAELAACGCNGGAGKTYPLIQDLLAHWTARRILPPEQIEQAQQRALHADGSSWDSLLELLSERGRSGLEQGGSGRDKTTWMLPVRHGVTDDPTAPWHELPAANGLYMMRTRGYPLRANAFPQGGFPVRDGGEEADAPLKKEVHQLYNDVLRCYDKYTKAEEVQDMDALGNIIWKDVDRPTRNYWGFTIDGIARRKELARGFADSATGYADYGPAGRVNDAVERARALAAERGRGFARGRGGMNRGGWRGGQRW